MIRYLLVSLMVMLLAFYVVSFGVKKTKMSEKIDEAMDVPYGEYKSMSIKKADGDDKGYFLMLNGVSLYSTRKGTGTMCNADVKMLFNTEREAKLVMKFRYNLGPFMAEPLRRMTPDQAAKPQAEQAMIKSLKDGYAAQYGIKTFQKIVFSNLHCRNIK